MNIYRRFLSAVVAAALLFGVCSIGAWADDEPEPEVNPSQICVTVPLYVCMYASNNSGRVFVPTKESYGIKNYSPGEIVIKTIQGFGEEFALIDGPITELDVKQVYMAVDGIQVTGVAKTVDWNIGEGDPENGVTYGLQLSAAIVGGQRNQVGEVKACRIEYTFEYLPVEFELSYTSEHGTTPDDVTTHKHMSYIVSDMAADGYTFLYWESARDVDASAGEAWLNKTYPGMWTWTDASHTKAHVVEKIYPGDLLSPLEDITLSAVWEMEYPSKFHASSNYLETDGASYTVADPDGYIDILLYNYEKTNTALVNGRTNTDETDETLRTNMTLQYTVTLSSNAAIDSVTNAAGSGSTYTVACDGVTKTVSRLRIKPASGTAWAENDKITVSVTASDPDASHGVIPRTMTGEFTILTEALPEYTVTTANGMTTLEIRTNDYNGDITVTWPNAKLTPDNTNDLVANWYNSAATGSTTKTLPDCRQDTVYRLVFFGTGTAATGKDTKAITLN